MEIISNFSDYYDNAELKTIEEIDSSITYNRIMETIAVNNIKQDMCIHINNYIMTPFQLLFCGKIYKGVQCVLNDKSEDVITEPTMNFFYSEKEMLNYFNESLLDEIKKIWIKLTYNEDYSLTKYRFTYPIAILKRINITSEELNGNDMCLNIVSECSLNGSLMDIDFIKLKSATETYCSIKIFLSYLNCVSENIYTKAR